MRRTVRVRPGASRTAVGGSYPGAEAQPALVVAVQVPAEGGRANQAVIAALASALGLRRWQLTLVSGHSSRTKVIELPDECAQAWQQLLVSSPGKGAH